MMKSIVIRPRRIQLCCKISTQANQKQKEETMREIVAHRIFYVHAQSKTNNGRENTRGRKAHLASLRLKPQTLAQ